MQINTSFSDSGSTSDQSFSSTDLAAQEWASSDRSFSLADLLAWDRASFMFPAKGRANNPITLLTTSQTELLKRFVCLEDDNPKNGDTPEENFRKSSVSGSGRNRSRGENPPSSYTMSSVFFQFQI